MRKLGILALIGTGLMSGSLALADRFTSTLGEPALQPPAQKVIELGQLDTGVPPGFETGERNEGNGQGGEGSHKEHHKHHHQDHDGDYNHGDAQQGNYGGHNHGGDQGQMGH